MLDQPFFISDTLTSNQRNQLLDLFGKQFWLKDRTLKDIETMERSCLIFALIERETDDLVGFTRVLTDNVKYAYIHDVLIKEDLHGKGLGRLLIESALNHDKLKEIVCFELLCLPEKIPFYKKFQFNEHQVMSSLRLDKRQLNIGRNL